MRNVRSVENLYPNTIMDILNIANLPHLISSDIDVNGDTIIEEGLNFDSMNSLFITQYCSGDYIDINEETGLINIKKHNRNFKKANFFIENSTSTFNMPEYIDINNGILSSSININLLPKTLKALTKNKTLFGIVIEEILHKEIMNLLLETPEFQQLVVMNATIGDEYPPGILDDAKLFLSKNKLKVLIDDPNWPSLVNDSVADNQLFLESLPIYPNSILKTWGLPININYIPLLLKKFPNLKSIAISVNLKPIDIPGFEQLGLILYDNPKIKSIIIDIPHYQPYELLDKENMISKFKDIINRTAKRNINIKIHD